MNIYINDPELIKKLEAEAKKSDRSISYVVRERLNKSFNGKGVEK